MSARSEHQHTLSCLEEFGSRLVCKITGEGTKGAKLRQAKISEAEGASTNIERTIRSEIGSYQPLGIASEISMVLGARPKRGVVIGTPLGPYVFARARQPPPSIVKGWWSRYRVVEARRKESARLHVSPVSWEPNTTTGNIVALQQAERLVSEGMASPDELRATRALRAFWNKYPKALYGIWRTGMQIEPVLKNPWER